LASARRQIKIESIHIFGLLCHPNEKLTAFSPDAIAGVLVDKLPSGPTCYVALVEMKSKWCSQVTLAQENNLIAEFGEYQEIDAEEDPELFKQSIPDALYRYQLLHGTASGALNHAFFVVESLATENNPCRSCSNWVPDMRTGPNCDYKFESATSKLDRSENCASNNIQNTVPCSWS
jgi:hypothetical protein